MWDLLSQMFSRMAIIITIAFLITRLSIFRQMIHRDLNIKGRLFLIFIFGIFGIIGNYTAIVVGLDAYIQSVFWHTKLQMDSAIADTRNIGIIIGGFIGGPWVGLGAALLSGGHRLIMGGFISVAAFFTSILGGFLSGLFGKILRKIGLIRPLYMFFVSIFILTVQVLLIPLLSNDKLEALHLISYTGIPIVLINSIGIWICSIIFYSVIQEEERTRASQTAKALSIANRTLSLFRKGLNETSAIKAASIIKQLTNFDDIAITRGIRQLAHTGDKGIKKEELDYRKQVLQSGKLKVIQSYREIFKDESLFYHSFIIVPLLVKQKPIGTITFYFKNPFYFTSVEKELVEGLGHLFSSQLELGEVERYNSLLQDAKIKALYAQIQPHFLFNSLHTIIALCRFEPMTARDLLLNLSTFLRNNLTGQRERLVKLEKELENVNAYLSIEQARFPDNFQLNMKIQPEVKSLLIPPFILQPLVENAVIHGDLKNMDGNGKIDVEAKMISDELLYLAVTDNGKGILPDRLSDLGERVVKPTKDGSGSALYNIKERLTALYSQDARFKIESKIDEGTSVSIILPVKMS